MTDLVGQRSWRQSMGTHGDDDITAQGVAANSVDVWVNDGPRVRYVGVATVNLQGKNGDDDFDIDIEVSALGVTFGIDGGSPAVSGDIVTVTGVSGLTNDNALWVPTANTLMTAPSLLVVKRSTSLVSSV
ncbi:MAG: hypothetical protein H6823_24330 [Planctomycetaceae bacterium]|nr:hypothetical protein [Planctomycetaceae bacterium]